MRRHRDVLNKKNGKLTSPTRKSCNINAKTQAFIKKLNRSVTSNWMNSHNVVIFDETVIVDSIAVPVILRGR